jgi:dTDP-4-dehydrorhamnose 3,5-epimerase
MLPTMKNLDTRGWSYFDIYKSLPGQINVSVLMPGIVKAFHWHAKQTDYWFCCQGNIHVIVATPKDPQLLTYPLPWSASDFDIRHYYIGEQNPRTLDIPPWSLHGYTNIGNESTTLIYYVDKKYDMNQPDEHRLKYDIFGESIWKPTNE